MIFSEAALEARELQAEVVGRTELSESFTRLLLQDAAGQALYCWLEGEPWMQTARRFQVGAHLTLGPYRRCKVPAEYKDFYLPYIQGLTIADSCIHFPPYDTSVSLGLSSERVLTLKEAYDRAMSQPGFRCDIAGVVVDIVQRDTCNDRLWRLKLADSSLESDYINVHLFVKKQEALKPVFESLGDIVALQGVNIALYQGKPQISVNRNSDGWGMFGLEKGEVMAKSAGFKTTEAGEMQRKALRKWAVEWFSRHSLCRSDLTVPRLGQLSKYRYKKVDVVGKVVRLCKGFPPGMSTILLCDESGFASIECFDFNFEGLKEGCWAKARQVKVESTLRLDQYSSVVPIPELFFDVQSRVRGADLPGMALITHEAMTLLQQRIWAFDQARERLVTRCMDEQIPLWTGKEVLSPLSTRKYVRLKGLLVGVEPQIAECFEPRFAAVLRCLSDGEVVEVLLGEREGREFFGMRSFEGVAARKQVADRLELLRSANNWVELGVHRVVWDNRVLLRLYRTTFL